jgi:hypothetical protein
LSEQYRGGHGGAQQLAAGQAGAQDRQLTQHRQGGQGKQNKGLTSH